MAKKISELDDLGTTPANDDVFPLTDVSDTSEALSGTTKKVQVGDFLGSVVNHKNIFRPFGRMAPLSGVEAAPMSVIESSAAGDKPMIPILTFSGTTEQAGQWTGEITQTFTTLTLKIMYYMQSANTSKTVKWIANVCAVGDGTTSVTAVAYDSDNAETVTVPDAVGTVDVASVVLTNNDSVGIGDWYNIMIKRDPDDDTAEGNAAFLVAWIEYA